MNVAIVSGSARPRRQSHQVALSVKERLGLMNIDHWIWDVKETNLPLLDWTFASHPEPGGQLRELKEKLDRTDAFILVSPEHNASFPGSLKNSMDYFFDEYANKVFGIIGVSAGVLGGINAVKALQSYALKVNGLVCPHFLITPRVQTLYEDGKLKDEAYSGRLDHFLTVFLELAQKIRS